MNIELCDAYGGCYSCPMNQSEQVRELEGLLREAGHHVGRYGCLSICATVGIETDVPEGFITNARVSSEPLGPVIEDDEKYTVVAASDSIDIIPVHEAE